MSFDRYIETLNKSHNQAVKVEWLNPDESVNFEFTNAIYNMQVDLSVNYQSGSRRTCTITINNDKNKFPINFNNIWMGQKFKLWLGVYLDDKTPCYFPQGVFYVSNPNETYNPSTRTITLSGVDKWAYLDGTLFGKLSGTYQTNINNNLYDAIKSLLKLSRYENKKTDVPSNMIDPVEPFLSPYFLTKMTTANGVNQPVYKCPYTAIVERGKSLADVLLEYATILCANVYYDVNGRLTLEPMSNTVDDLVDTDKEILWHFTVDEKTFLGLTQTYNFDKVYNDFIVLGNITNGYQFKGRVQNRNPLSNTCVQKIGLKTKDPFEDNKYVSNQQCLELAKYYAKTDTILQKSGSISSVAMYHLDVNKLVTLSTPNNDMSKELFLINGFDLSTSGTMNINVTSVNILKDFSTMDDFVIYDSGKSEYLDLSKASTWYDTTKIHDVSPSCSTSYTGNSISISVRTGISDFRKVFTATIPLLKSFPDLVGYNKLHISFGSGSYMNYIASVDWTGQSRLSVGINGENTVVKHINSESSYDLYDENVDILSECRGDSNSNFVISLEHGMSDIASRSGSLAQKLIIKKIWLSII